MIQYVLEKQPEDAVFTGDIDAQMVEAVIEPDTGVLHIPLKIRITKNLIPSNVDIRRKREQGPLLTLHAHFEPSAECLKSRLQQGIFMEFRRRWYFFLIFLFSLGRVSSREIGSIRTEC